MIQKLEELKHYIWKRLAYFFKEENDTKYY